MARKGTTRFIRIEAFGATSRRDRTNSRTEAGRHPAGLLEVLAGQRDAIVRALTKRLLVYALGRVLESADRPAANENEERLKRGAYRFSRMGVRTESIADSTGRLEHQTVI